MILFHASNEIFEKPSLDFHKSGFYPGFYASKTPELAQSYGTYLYMFEITGDFKEINSQNEDLLLKESGRTSSGYLLAEKLKAEGYSGIIRGNEVIIFDVEDILNFTRLKTLQELTQHIPQLVNLAQEEYDGWSQDENGYDELVGNGGICHLIAEQIANHLSNKDFPITTHSLDTEVHVICLIALQDGVYKIDVPHRLYERGGGYNWTKINNVVFDESSIFISRIGTLKDWTFD